MRPLVLLVALLTGAALAWGSARVLRSWADERQLMTACVADRAPPGVTITGGRPAALPDDLLMTLEERPCGFDACPVFTVTVDAQGRVTWTGVRNVAVTGTAHARLGAHEVEDLVVAFCSAGFRDMHDDSRHACTGLAYVTDMPQWSVALRSGGVEKRVEHDFGCNAGAELGRLTRLEAYFARAVGLERWVSGR